MKRTVLLSALLCITAWQSHAQNLRDDINLSDPFVMADPVSEKYYMTGTGGGLWVSSDLETWTNPTWPVQTTETSWMGARPQVWASEIHYVDGIYYNLSTFTTDATTIDADGHPRRAVHVLSSRLPDGPYTLISGGDATYVPESKCTLDASLFTDTDGQRYLLYCHEWIQNGNGTVEAVPLRNDMKGTAGAASVLFRAHDATWNTSPVTDGPFAFRTQTGRLGIIWTSWHGDRYVQGVAYSTSGTLRGPWVQQALPITPDDYGHGMLFRTFNGKLLMSIHSHRTIDESRQLWERHPKLFLMDDLGDELRTVMEYRYQTGLSRPARVMVNNPEFEYGKLGWTCTTNAQNQLIAHNQGGAITGNFYESWDANSYVGDIYQELQIPNGTYRLTAAAFRSAPMAGGSNSVQSVVLFANNATTTVTSETPQEFSVTVTVTDGRLRFGLRSNRKNYQWMGIDNVRLLYYGPETYTDDQITAAADQRIYLRNERTGRWLGPGKSWGTQATIVTHPFDFSLIPLPGGLYALDSRLNNGGGNHFASSDGYLDGPLSAFSIGDLGEGRVSLSTDGGLHFWGNTSGTTLSTALYGSTLKGAQWRLLTRADLMDSLYMATTEQPADATFLIACPDFGRNDTRIDAWQGEFSTGGDVTNYCAESKAKTFTVSQTIEGIPDGYYELTAQGFYRYGTTANAKTARSEAEEQLLAHLFLNDAYVPLPSIFTPREGRTITSPPTTLDVASAKFTSGQYTCSVLARVSGGRLTLGVRKTDEAAPDADWTVFDNFQLKYYGPQDPTSIEETVNGQWSLVNEIYDLQGRRLPCLQRGLNIVNGHKILIR